MRFQFTHPLSLVLLVPALAWVLWFAWKSDVQVGLWRRSLALAAGRLPSNWTLEPAARKVNTPPSSATSQ